MAYLIWALIGILIGVLVTFQPGQRVCVSMAIVNALAGAMGAVVGGLLGDGVPDWAEPVVNQPSIGSALIGATLYCWVVREAPDASSQSSYDRRRGIK